MPELKTKVNKWPVQLVTILDDFELFVGVEYANWVDKQGVSHFEVTPYLYDRFGYRFDSGYSPGEKGNPSGSGNLDVPLGKDIFNLIQEEDQKEKESN